MNTIDSVKKLARVSQMMQVGEGDEDLQLTLVGGTQLLSATG